MDENAVICIIMAMDMEAEPFIEGMSLQCTEETPFKIYRRENYILALSGIGKANAAMTTAYCCQAFDPDLLFNFGAAGSVKMSCSPGEILHVDHVIEYDRPAIKTGEPCRYTPRILEGFKTVRLATQDRPVVEENDRKEVARHADLVDMEAASVLQACRRFRKECVIFKFVSDTPGHTKGKDIIANIKKYREDFYFFIKNKVLDPGKLP